MTKAPKDLSNNKKVADTFCNALRVAAKYAVGYRKGRDNSRIILLSKVGEEGMGMTFDLGNCNFEFPDGRENIVYGIKIELFGDGHFEVSMASLQRLKSCNETLDIYNRIVGILPILLTEE